MDAGTEPLSPDDLETRLEAEFTPDLKILKLLGGSSTVAVYLAREPALARLVALKVLRPAKRSEGVAHARFEREARAVASLAHPNVVAVHRYGRLSDGSPFLVMQYVQGRSLEERLAAEGRLSPVETRRILADVAAALAAAHAHGIIHRNVRPSKILVEQETGRALLSDFGVAAVLDAETGGGTRLTRTGQVVGDPRYMSPEWLEGETLTPAADLYSLGIVGYELLTGAGPYGELPPGALLGAHLQQPPRPVQELPKDVDPELRDLLPRCLARLPVHRPDAAFLARTLGRESAPEVLRAGGVPPSFGSAVDDLFRRRLPQFVLAAAALGWLLLQFVDQLVQQRILPQAVYPLTLALVLFGLCAVGVLSWFHGVAGRQQAKALEIWLLAALAAGWIATSAVILL